MTQSFVDYVEPTDEQILMKFLAPALQRQDFLATEPDLTIEELLEESEGQLLEAFAFFLSLEPEQQARVASQFREGLRRVEEARERNREKAQRLLAKRGVRV